jgi:hypothetical protein
MVVSDTFGRSLSSSSRLGFLSQRFVIAKAW